MTTAEKIQKVRRAEYDYCKGNLLYWIDNYCPIEDKDAPEIILPFRAWDEQRELIRSIDKHRLNIILKARQLGVTWIALYYCLHDLIFNIGHTVIALSKTETEAVELVRRAKVILGYQPEILAGGEITVNATIQQITLTKGDKESVFKSFPSSENTARTFTANILLLDEWAFQQYAREIWSSAYPTINRPTGGKVIGLSTIKRGTLFEDLWTTENNFNKLFLSVFADPRRTIEWYEQTAKDLGALVKQEYPRTAEEALSNIGGSFYPEFDDNIHVVTPFAIPDHWRRYSAMDYGYDKLAYGLFAVDINGNHYQVAEIHKSGLTVTDAAKEMDNLINQMGWTDKSITEFAPTDLWNRSTQTGKSPADMFATHGHSLVETNRNFINGCIAVKELLRVYVDEESNKPTARLKIFRNCEYTIRYIKEILTDEKNPNIYAKAPHEYTHINDMLRYYAIAWTGKADKLPKDKTHWEKDQWEDYYRASTEERKMLIKKWGDPA